VFVLLRLAEKYSRHNNSESWTLSLKIPDGIVNFFDVYRYLYE
jgi:hypothetical protein